MARDGLLPRYFAKVHPEHGTPYVTTIVTGLVVALGAALMDDDATYDLTNIGTLFEFILVSIAVIILRRTRPELPRSFRVPLVPVLPILSALACFWLMLNLPGETWLRFAIWMVIGLGVYCLYSRRHSRFAHGGRREERQEEVASHPEG
jgi:APA family basic amino acid/polyamine antiporter